MLSRRAALPRPDLKDIKGTSSAEVPSSKHHLFFSGPPWLGPGFSALCLQRLCWILLCFPQNRTQLGAVGWGAVLPRSVSFSKGSSGKSESQQRRCLHEICPIGDILLISGLCGSTQATVGYHTPGQHSSMVSDFLGDGLWQGNVGQTNPFLPKLLWTWCFSIVLEANVGRVDMQ